MYIGDMKGKIRKENGREIFCYLYYKKTRNNKFVPKPQLRFANDSLTDWASGGELEGVRGGGRIGGSLWHWSRP